MESTHDENAHDLIEFADESSIFDMLDDESDGCFMCKMADPEFRKKVKEEQANIMKGVEEWAKVDV